MSNIQAILFDINKWTPTRSRRWLMNHNHIPIKKAHKTERFYRYRLMEPNKNNRYITLNIGNGIEFIIEYTNS